ncbi:MAG: dTMP kinase [Candidatus Parcubacteria bacterium]|jgi:dTMP kinase|nr:dTMP kinase [Candidatus Parcubacteria bacterium]
MRKGLLLVFDGNDGSGKATQSRLLAEYLNAKGVPAERVDFPAYDRNVFGTLIGECLSGRHGDFVNLDPKIASTLYALDRFESSDAIRKHLEAGTVVVADRFTSANQIHQGGKIADVEERKRFLSWLELIEHGVLGVPRPDAIFYLRVPLDISLELLLQKRASKNSSLDDGQKDTVEDDRAYLERSHETATWLASHEPNWRVVDCEKDGTMRAREDIHGEIVQAVLALLKP